MATQFPTFARVYGWAYIFYLFNQAFLAYFYPERLFGQWTSLQPEFGGMYKLEYK